MLNWIKRKIVPKAPETATTVEDLASRQMVCGWRTCYTDAERCYRQVQESEGDYPAALVADADSHCLLGSILQSTGPRDAEISHLRKAVDLPPDFELVSSQLIAAETGSSVE